MNTTNAIQAMVLAAAGNGGSGNPNSRYYGDAILSLVLPDGTEVKYLQRRIIPPPSIYSSLQAHTIVDGDRIDNLAATYLGDPTLYWLICDSNAAMNADALTQTPGQAVQIPVGAAVPAGARNG